MVKDVSASCAIKALRAPGTIRWTLAVLALCGNLVTASELPARLSLQQAAADPAHPTAQALPVQPFPVQPFDLILPGTDTLGLSSASDSINQQQLSFPLSQSVRLDVAVGGSDRSSMMSRDYAGTTGTWKPAENLSFKAGVGLSQQNYGLINGVGQALPVQSSICATGTSNYLNCLANRAGSGNDTLQTYMIGANWKAFGRVSVSLDYTDRNLESNPAELGTVATLGNAALIDQIGSSGISLYSRTQALDFSLSCDIGAGNWGDLEFGLQVSRIMTQGGLAESVPGDALTDPYTQASLGVGWKLGDFRSDFTSRYLDVLDGQGNNLTPWTSLDVNFSWQTPWNGSLSVGARNVFNNPAPGSNGLIDPNYDELFGRVPYVRYRQDL